MTNRRHSSHVSHSLTWKLANVVPIPKTIPPTRIDKDLRPISLTPTLSKALESFVGQWILDELKGKLDSVKNYQNCWKFDEVLTKTNLLSFFGTRCKGGFQNYKK